MADGPPWRLFVALPLAEGVRSELALRIDRLKSSEERARWVAPENLHVTLLFIGNRDPADVPGIVAAMQTVAHARSAYRIELTGSGTFGGDRRGRILWLGVRRGRKETAELSSELARRIPTRDVEATELIAAPEPRPHLTLARAAAGGLAATARAMFDELSPLGWCVEGIHLYRSHTGTRAPVYQELASVSLAGGNAPGLGSAPCP